MAMRKKLTAEEINSLTPEQAATLTEKTGIYKALKGTGLAMKIAGWAKNAKEAFDTFAKYQSIADLKDGTEQLLTLIANDTNNPIELREAASDCVGYFGEGYQRALNQLYPAFHKPHKYVGYNRPWYEFAQDVPYLQTPCCGPHGRNRQIGRTRRWAHSFQYSRRQDL